MSEANNPLTEEVRAMIGVSGEKLEASPPWGIEREGLRIFCNAIMDPDPRYWDDAFARSTKFGTIVTPPIYCSYLGMKTMQDEEDPISRAFAEDPNSDGIGGVRQGGDVGKTGLPVLPTPLTRILNAGNEIEVYKYPTLGDHIFSQARYSDIQGRITRDGAPMLVTTVEMTYTDQDDEVLCIVRQSQIRR
jgi:hypothetical protein